VRIGHAVEYEQQRRLGGVLEHVGERHVRQRGVGDRHDALVALAAGQFPQPSLVDGMHGDAGGFRANDEVSCPRVVPSGRDVDRPHRLRTLPESGGNGVEADDETGV
jgi:hypothetical protein